MSDDFINSPKHVPDDITNSPQWRPPFLESLLWCNHFTIVVNVKQQHKIMYFIDFMNPLRFTLNISPSPPLCVALSIPAKITNSAIHISIFPLLWHKIDYLAEELNETLLICNHFQKASNEKLAINSYFPDEMSSYMTHMWDFV